MCWIRPKADGPKMVVEKLVGASILELQNFSEATLVRQTRYLRHMYSSIECRLVDTCDVYVTFIIHFIAS